MENQHVCNLQKLKILIWNILYRLFKVFVRTYFGKIKKRPFTSKNLTIYWVNNWIYKFFLFIKFWQNIYSNEYSFPCFSTFFTTKATKGISVVPHSFFHLTSVHVTFFFFLNWQTFSRDVISEYLKIILKSEMDMLEISLSRTQSLWLSSFIL